MLPQERYIDMLKSRIVELSSVKGILLTDHQYQNVIDISDELYLMKDGVIKRINKIEYLKFYGYIR